MSRTEPTKVPAKGFYRHYKHDPNGSFGNFTYELVALGYHTEEDGVHFIVYRPLYKEAQVYQASQRFGLLCADVRPLSMWMETVEKDGKVMPRFELITDEVEIAKLEGLRDQMYSS
ncbi:MAG: DUF1653 domain-containing protein [Candidatus Paceibacterota bacterium]